MSVHCFSSVAWARLSSRFALRSFFFALVRSFFVSALPSCRFAFATAFSADSTTPVAAAQGGLVKRSAAVSVAPVLPTPNICVVVTP